MSRDACIISLRGMRAYGRHGADALERAHPQPLELDLEIDVEADAARTTDALHDTIDYAALQRRVSELVATTSFALLERLGQRIVDALMDDPRVRSASVTLAKPGCLDGATPAVTVRSERRTGG